MSRVRDIIGRTLFWSYDRGTLPYDLMVAAIVLFVFLSPRGWFNDRPAEGAAPNAAAVQALEPDPDTGLQVYRVQASLLSQPKPDPAFERKLHEVLSKNVPELRGHTFQIRSVQTGQEDNGAIRYYDVAVKK